MTKSHARVFHISKHKILRDFQEILLQAWLKMAASWTVFAESVRRNCQVNLTVFRAVIHLVFFL